MDVYCWAYHINPSIPVIMVGVPRFSNVGRRRQRTSEPAHVCVFQWDLYCMSYEANIFDHGWKGTDSLNSTIMCLTCLQTSYLSIYLSINQSSNQSINQSIDNQSKKLDTLPNVSNQLASLTNSIPLFFRLNDSSENYRLLNVETLLLRSASGMYIYIQNG